MRPLTKEEYEELEFAKTPHHYNYTKIPPTLNKIWRHRAERATDIIMWLISIGGEVSYLMNESRDEIFDRMCQNTAFEIKVRHDNDYIEMGPLGEDPNNDMFIVKTPFETGISFLPENLKVITQQLELFSSSKLPINQKMPDVNLNFYSYERKLKVPSMYEYSKYEMKLTYSLKFDIYHSWGSTQPETYSE